MKKILFLSTLLAVTLQAMAADVDVATAMATAQRFTTQAAIGPRRAAPSGTNNVRLIHTELNTSSVTQAVYYIFNTDDSYIIVAGDDRATEVLAYGDSPLDMNNIPEGLQYWLDCYKGQLEYLQAHPAMVVDNGPRRLPGVSLGETVEPLLTALWDQSAPYNNQCPYKGGRRCITGCAATSLAMVFYYWKYPTEPTPTVPAYVTASEQIYVNELPSTTFDWDNMLNRYRGGYSSAQANAVAWLMRYIGQAEEMDYAPDGSGSYGENILETALLFGYDSDTELIYKTSWDGDELYTDDEWAEIIQEELYARRPIVMCGYANGFNGMSGHAFNIDGYDADMNMYHINWGWSGSGNAHFALNAFKGGGSTYNIVQQIIVGMEPTATVPTIKPSAKRMRLETLVDHVTSMSLKVKGVLLTGDVQLELNDNTGMFSLDEDHINRSEITSGTHVKVNYAPLSPGTHTAVLTLKSEGAKDVNIKITGTSQLETYTPELTERYDIGTSSITVNWDDATPAKNVSTYRLEVAKVPYSELALKERFDHENATWSGSADCSSHLDEITATPGWTGSKVYMGEDYLRLGNNSTKGWLETPAVNMLDSKGLMTVKVTAKCVTSDNGAALRISCGDNDTTVMITPEATEYSVLLPCPISKDAKMRLTNAMTGKRVLLYNVEVITGDDFSPIDQSTVFYIDGITGSSCKVDGLSPDTYALSVQAIYTDGTRSMWSARLRLTVNGMRGDVNRDGEINIADVNTIIHVMLSSNASTRLIGISDINGDGEVNLGDINAVIDIILNAN